MDLGGLCGRPDGHGGQHRSPESVKQRYARKRFLRRIPGTYEHTLRWTGDGYAKALFHTRRRKRKQATQRDLQTLKEILNGST
jgi:hypothetical protein